jgi:hypothetical protein
MPAAPLTAEQRAQMAANKAKAATVKAAKEKSSMMKQPSMLSFFSPVVKVRHCSAVLLHFVSRKTVAVAPLLASHNLPHNLPIGTTHSTDSPGRLALHSAVKLLL